MVLFSPSPVVLPFSDAAKFLADAVASAAVFFANVLWPE